jgi:hypothetical protein
MDSISSSLPEHGVLDTRKAQARAWFESLRDDLCEALEAVEDSLPAGAPIGRPGVSCARPGAEPTIPAAPAAAASCRS